MTCVSRTIAIFSTWLQLAQDIKQLILQLERQFLREDPTLRISVNPDTLSKDDIVVLAIAVGTFPDPVALGLINRARPRSTIIFSRPDAILVPQLLSLFNRNRFAVFWPYIQPIKEEKEDLARLILGQVIEAPDQVIVSARVEAQRYLTVVTADFTTYQIPLRALELEELIPFTVDDIEIDDTLYAIVAKGRISVPLHVIRYHGDLKFRQQQDARARRERDSLGKRIRDERERKGITQQELATAAGISRKQLSLIENGEVQPHVRTLERICEALDMTLEVLLVNLSRKPKPDVPPPSVGIVRNYHKSNHRRDYEERTETLPIPYSPSSPSTPNPIKIDQEDFGSQKPWEALQSENRQLIGTLNHAQQQMQDMKKELQVLREENKRIQAENSKLRTDLTLSRYRGSQGQHESGQLIHRNLPGQ